MDLGFTVRILKENDTFVAHVSELDVSSCGDTEVDARRNIAEPTFDDEIPSDRQLIA